MLGPRNSIMDWPFTAFSATTLSATRIGVARMIPAMPLKNPLRDLGGPARQ